MTADVYKRQHGNIVFLDDAQSSEGPAAAGIKQFGGMVNHVGFIQRHRCSIDGFNEAALRLLHPHPVVQRQRQSESIESGAQIGAGSGYGLSLIHISLCAAARMPFT